MNARYIGKMIGKIVNASGTCDSVMMTQVDTAIPQNCPNLPIEILLVVVSIRRSRQSIGDFGFIESRMNRIAKHRMNPISRMLLMIVVLVSRVVI